MALKQLELICRASAVRLTEVLVGVEGFLVQKQVGSAVLRLLERRNRTGVTISLRSSYRM